MVDVSVVIVSFNTRGLLDRCLSSVESERDHYPGVIEVLMVDAGSTDGTVEMVRDRHPRVQALPTAENLGFTRGNNRALRVARGSVLLLLNPDTELRPGAVERLVTTLSEREHVAAVGPRLLYPDGSVQPSRRRFPTAATGFIESTVFQRWLGWMPLLRRFYMNDISESNPHEVDWLVGACLALRSDALRQVGLFDESFFMYSEETDLCHRLRLAGWRCWYEPRAVVVHHEGKSSEQNLALRNLRFHESRFRYYRKYFGATLSLALRVVILGHFLLMGAEELGKLILRRRNRSLRRARLGMLSTVLRAQCRSLVANAVGRN